jgi:hypothetical protein
LPTSLALSLYFILLLLFIHAPVLKFEVQLIIFDKVMGI